MASPLESYFRDNPEARQRDRYELLQGLYSEARQQEDFTGEDFETFAERMLRDPDNPLGWPRRPARRPAQPEPWKPPAHRPPYEPFWPRLLEGVKEGITLPGDVATGRAPILGKEGRTSEDVIRRSAELAGIVGLSELGLSVPSSMARWKAERELQSLISDLNQYINAADPEKAKIAAKIKRDHPNLDIERAAREISLMQVPPDDPIRSMVKEREQPKSQLSLFDRVYTELKDELWPFARAEREIYGHWPGSHELLAEESVYKRSRLMRGIGDQVDLFVNYGTARLTDLFGPEDSFALRGKGLRQIWAPIADDPWAAIRYSVYKRALEKEGQGIKTGFDVNEASRVVAEVESAAASGSATAGRLVQFHRDMTEYNHALLLLLRDSRYISEEQYQKIRAKNLDYSFPFYRAIEDQFVQGAPPSRSGRVLHKMEGVKGSVPIEDVLQTVIRNTYAFLHVAQRNEVAGALYRLLLADGEGKFGRIVAEAGAAKKAPTAAERGLVDTEDDQAEILSTLSAPRRRGANEIVYMSDGEPIRMQVDAEIRRAFEALDGRYASLLERIASFPAKLLRAGVTLDPGFSIGTNPIRDQFVAMATSIVGDRWRPLYIPFFSAMRGLSGMVRNPDQFYEWLMAGGGQSTLVSIDVDFLRTSLNRMKGGPGYFIRHPIEALQWLQKYGENITRFGGYMAFRRAGYDALDAAYMTRELTVDFLRMGRTMQVLNRMSAFQNAQMEGVDRIVRAFAGNAPKITLAAIGSITLPSLMLWEANRNDPRYRNLPAWEKYIYWHIFPFPDWRDVDEREAKLLRDVLPVRQLPSGRWQADYAVPIRIPKPFELGIVFGSVPEQLMEKFVQENPEAFKDIGKAFSSAFIPNLWPTLVQPLIEIRSNYSFFFERPLVPRYLQSMLPEYRYTEFTSQLARKISGVLSQLPPLQDDPVVTPIAIDHWVRAWGGTIGRYALRMADEALAATGVASEPVRPTPTAADRMIIGRFVSRYPATNAAAIAGFYERYLRQEQILNSLRELGRRPDQDAAEAAYERYYAEQGERLAPYARALNTMRQFIRDVDRNPRLSADEKRKLIDTEIFRMIAIATEANRIHDESLKADRPARALPAPQQEPPPADPRLARFARLRNNRIQQMLLQQMSLADQLRFAPHAAATTRTQMIMWFSSLDAELQRLLLLELGEGDPAFEFWLAASAPEVKESFGRRPGPDTAPRQRRPGARPERNQ